MPDQDLIQPNHPPHQKFEAEVIAFAREYGFSVHSTTYHDVMPAEAQKRLQLIESETSLYVRTKSDRVVIHNDRHEVFLLEVKTNTGKYANAAIEAMPLAWHRESARFGTRCLYCYSDPIRKIEGAFWVKPDLPFDRLVIPLRKRYMKPQLTLAYPNLKTQEMDLTANGSDDPFVIIKELPLRKLLVDWRMVIADMAKGTSLPI